MINGNVTSVTECQRSAIIRGAKKKSTGGYRMSAEANHTEATGGVGFISARITSECPCRINCRVNFALVVIRKSKNHFHRQRNIPTGSNGNSLIRVGSNGVKKTPEEVEKLKSV